MIFKYFSYADSIQFGRTCKRFFAEEFMKRCDRDFCSAFDKFFRTHYNDYDNILHMRFSLSIIREHLNSRFIFGHLYWCKRSTNLTNFCEFCCQVRRCYAYDKSETETRYAYGLYHHQAYNQHHKSIFINDNFFSKDLNIIHKQCDYFEHI